MNSAKLVFGVSLVFMFGFAAVTNAYLSDRNAPVARGDIGGPFTMVDMSGKVVTQADLIGRPTALYFGFTSCPEACPTTLLTLTNAMKRMGPLADRLNFVFVTVDPQRDTPTLMKAYLSSFDPRIRGFIGSDQQIAEMAHAYRVAFRRVPLEGNDYTIEHTAAVLLLNAKATVAGLIQYGDSDTIALAKLTQLAGSP